MIKIKKVPFFITIDNEGDNGWSRPQKALTTCARGLERFQILCNKYGFKPVYLTNYEMAIDKTFSEMVRKYLPNNLCEIGLHLHAWNSPPIYNITDCDYKYVPYLIDYPQTVMRNKLVFLKHFLEERFDTTIISHRAGRWAINEIYVDELLKIGIKIDCSVCPGFNFSKSESFPGKYGTDYSDFAKQIGTIYNSKLIEVPMTTSKNRLFDNFLVGIIRKLVRNKKINSALENRTNVMLRPRKHNLFQLKRLVKRAIIKDRNSHLEFMIHSSELFAGTNPKWKTSKDIDRLYKKIDKLFSFISKFAYGRTFKEFLLDK